jgi:hypothetical protein
VSCHESSSFGKNYLDGETRLTGIDREGTKKYLLAEVKKLRP